MPEPIKLELLVWLLDSNLLLGLLIDLLEECAQIISLNLSEIGQPQRCTLVAIFKRASHDAHHLVIVMRAHILCIPHIQEPQLLIQSEEWQQPLKVELNLGE